MMAVTSLQRSVGGTLGESAMRLQSALAGSALGLLCLLLVPEGWGVAGAFGVALGAVIGALVSLLVWPARAEARFERQFRDALRAAALRLSDAVGAVARTQAGPPWAGRR